MQRYSDEEKRNYVEKIKELRQKGRRFQDIADELGISLSSCYLWVRETKNIDNDSIETLKRENEMLRKLLGEILIKEKLRGHNA